MKQIFLVNIKSQVNIRKKYLHPRNINNTVLDFKIIREIDNHIAIFILNKLSTYIRQCL